MQRILLAERISIDLWEVLSSRRQETKCGRGCSFKAKKSYQNKEINLVEKTDLEFAVVALVTRASFVIEACVPDDYPAVGYYHMCALSYSHSFPWT